MASLLQLETHQESNDWLIPFLRKLFTDGSKTETGTGSWIFSDDLDISVSLRLPNTYMIFQAGMYAINVASKHIIQFSFWTSILKSLGAIKAHSRELNQKAFMIEYRHWTLLTVIKWIWYVYYNIRGDRVIKKRLNE